MTERYAFVGSIGNGERVYLRPSDADLAVEKDHSYLEEPTDAERAEIMECMSHVRAWVREKQGGESCPKPETCFSPPVR